MSRKRYIYDKETDSMIEVSADYEGPSRGGGASGDSMLWNDRLYQDSNDPRFKSRKQHRDFMRREGLTTVDDFKGEFRTSEQRRMDYRHKGTDPTRKQDLINAFQHHSQKRR